MRWLFALIALFAVLFSSTAAAAQAGTGGGSRWALLVGVDDYENPEVTDLRFAVADVSAVGDALQRSAGFPAAQVVRLVSTPGTPAERRPTPEAILKQMDQFAEKVGPDDTFVFYFSGHGFSRTDQSYLGTVNTDPRNATRLAASTLSLSTLQERMSRIRARSVLFIVDACRNDPLRGKGDTPNVLTENFSRDLVRVARSAAGGLAGTGVLFACSEGERAWEWGEKGHGIFTYYLLEGLEGKAAELNGDLTVTSLADYVQRQVVQWADEQDREQTPDLRQYGAARIVLAKLAATAPPAVASAASEAQDALHELQALLREHGFGLVGGVRVIGQQVIQLGDQLLWASRVVHPRASSMPRRARAPLRALDPDAVSASELRQGSSGPGRRVVIRTHGTRPVVRTTLWDKQEKPVAMLGFWVNSPEAAERGAKLLQRYVRAAQAALDAPER